MIQSLLIGTSITALSTLGALALVVWYFDPQGTGYLGISLFYLSLLGSLVSLLTLAGYWFRQRKKPGTLEDFWTSLRQAGIVSLLLLALLMLSANNLFHWWYWPIAIFLVLVIEIYLRVKVE